MGVYEESKHRRAAGKFASKPLSPADSKAHAITPVKKASLRSKVGKTEQLGDLHRRKDQVGKMNTGKKTRGRDA